MHPSKFQKLISFCAGALVALYGSSAVAAVRMGYRAPVESVGTIASGAAKAMTAADEESRTRVETALHADPYFYDAHVTVSVEKGKLVLGGFVFSDWDMRNALRIAHKAAGDVQVVNDLSIKIGGLR